MSSERLSPAEKTALIMLALGEDIAAEIFRGLEESEVKRVGAALSRMGRVEQETVDEVMKEFLEMLLNPSNSGLRGSADFASNVIGKAFGNSDYATELSNDLASANVRMTSLEIADAPTIYRIIANEHPQTIAMVLAHAGAQKAGAIIKLLPESIRTEIITRVTKLNAVQPEIIQEIDQMIRDEIDRMGIARKKIGGADKAAAILNALNDDRQEILDSLDERDPDLAESIRSHMFTFKDLAGIDDQAMRTLFKAVDRSHWELAMRGATKDLESVVYRNMSERAATTMKEDIEARGPQKKSDVLEAQQEIIQKALELEKDGKIILKQDEDMVV